MEVITVHDDILKFVSNSSRQTKSKIGSLTNLLSECGHNLRMPYSKQIDKNLFELRTKGDQEVRIFYCFYRNCAYLLHIFSKKSNKTPIKELKTAKKRLLQLTQI